MLENGEPAPTPASLGEQAGDPARGRPVFRQQQQPASRREMQPQRIERPAMQAQTGAIGKRPAEPCHREAECARLRQDRHLVAGKMAGEQHADPVPQRVAAGQYGDPPAAALGDDPERVGEWLGPDNPLGSAGWRERQMPFAADQGLGSFDQRARRRAQSGEPILADADDAEPPAHSGIPAIKALTAAATSALPPRRPLSAIWERPHPKPISASFASAAPTKPTGKPSTSAGFSAPSARISSRRNSAVGALPIA